MVDTRNMALYRWSTFRQRLNVIDENDLPVNLTGYGAKLQIRAAYGDATAVAHDASPYVSVYPWSCRDVCRRHADAGGG